MFGSQFPTIARVSLSLLLLLLLLLLLFLCLIKQPMLYFHDNDMPIETINKSIQSLNCFSVCVSVCVSVQIRQWLHLSAPYSAPYSAPSSAPSFGSIVDTFQVYRYRPLSHMISTGRMMSSLSHSPAHSAHSALDGIGGNRSQRHPVVKRAPRRLAPSKVTTRMRHHERERVD